MSLDLRITNLENGLSKIVNADKYSVEDFSKTFMAYESANFIVKFVRGLRD